MSASPPGAEGWRAWPPRTPLTETPEATTTKLSPKPCSSPLPQPHPLLFPLLPAPQCSQAQALAHTHAPGPPLLPSHLAFVLLQQGLNGDTLHSHNWQLAPIPPCPPMEVPYVSVMNKHEAPWLGGWEMAAANHQLSRHGVGATMEWVTTTRGVSQVGGRHGQRHGKRVGSEHGPWSSPGGHISR